RRRAISRRDLDGRPGPAIRRSGPPEGARRSPARSPTTIETPPTLDSFRPTRETHDAASTEPEPPDYRPDRHPDGRGDLSSRRAGARRGRAGAPGRRPPGRGARARRGPRRLGGIEQPTRGPAGARHLDRRGIRGPALPAGPIRLEAAPGGP